MTEWRRAPIADAAVRSGDALVDGPFGSNLKADEYVEAGVRLVQLQNIGEGHWLDRAANYISHAKAETLRRHQGNPGDIAIAKMADPVARACRLPEHEDKFVVVADCIRLRVDEERYDPSFVTYAINSAETRSEAEAVATGSTRVRINLAQLKRISIAAPPLDEQRRIAEILETVDETIRATARAIAKLSNHHEGLAEELTATPASADAWKEAMVTDIVDPSRPVTYGIVQPGPRQPEGEGVPMIRGQDYDNGIVRSEGLYWVLPSIAKPYARSSLRPDDLLLTIVGVSVGTVGQVPATLDGANLTQTTARVAIAPSLSSRYYFHFFQTRQFQREVGKHTVWSTRPRLNIEAFASMSTVVPPLHDQIRVAERLDASLQRIEAESATLCKLRLARAGLADDLLSGRVRTGAA